MVMEKRLFRVCAKTGRIVGLNRRWRWFNCVLPVVGLLALVWYLVRVIPKPSRANYPCQRAAMPLALGGLSYLLALFGVGAAFRRARKYARQNRVALAGVCVLVGAAAGVMVVRQNEVAASAASLDTPNAPIGVARGINPGRVVWSYDPSACAWSGNKDGTHWWDVNVTSQSRVDAMLSCALRSLTSTTNDADAWDALFRTFNRRRGDGDLSYADSARKSIAIKINQNPCNANNTTNYALNGVTAPAGDEYSITGNPHLLLALIKQLVAVGVAQTNIIICDPSGLNRGWGGPRTIADNIYQYIHPLYPGVRFVDGVGMQGRELATWPATNNIVYPRNASGETTSSGLRVCQQILDAGFFINMAIMKSHGDGPTLCGKNHYGSISGQRHGPIYGNSSPTYYSNLLPPMGHKELGEKTLLFMVDALYGAPGPNACPTKWRMTPFGNRWPASVFLSQDGVAIDSVGFDFLNAEWGLPQSTDYYLHEAAYAPGTNGLKLSGYAYRPNAGSSAFVGSLGVEEHWNNSTNKEYSRNLGTDRGIELLKLMPGVPSITLQLPGADPFPAGTNLWLQALVINDTNPVTEVRFYWGAQLLGASTGECCGVTWSNVPPGAYLLRAVGMDASGLSFTSNPVNVLIRADYVWDAEPASPGVQDGSGTWDLLCSNWCYGLANVRYDNSYPPTTVVFGAGNGPAGTITLATNITVGDLAFCPAGLGEYTIAGGGYMLNLAGTPSIKVAANCSPVLAAPIGGPGFSKVDAGTLTLTGDNSYSAAVSVNDGTLALAGNNSSATADVRVGANAVLRLSHTNALRGGLSLSNRATLQLRANCDSTFAPTNIALQSYSSVNYFNVDCADGVTTGSTLTTLTLAGSVFFPCLSDNALQVSGDHGYTLALGPVSMLNALRTLFSINAAPGISLMLASFTSGSGGNCLDVTGGGTVTIKGTVSNAGSGAVILFVNGGSVTTLQGPSVKNGTGAAYRFLVPNGKLVLDHSNALLDNTTDVGMFRSWFVLGPAINFGDVGSGLPFLIATNNAFNCAVWLGDSEYSSGGLKVAPNVTNYVSDGDVGFTNSGTMTIGGQNTSGTNTYANRIVLGWTTNRGKSVTLLAATGGEVDFSGGILRNGTDASAGVTVGDAAYGGTVRLAGTNTYLGSTRVVNGVLLLSGSLAGDAVVEGGGTLGGSGTLNGSLVVQSGGTLSPGDGLGLLRLQRSLSLCAVSRVRVELDASSGTCDKVLGATNVTYAGYLVVTNLSGTVAPGQSFQLFDAPLPAISTAFRRLGRVADCCGALIPPPAH